jgi:glycosyltransferase involved in cell wall biosynthesis
MLISTIIPTIGRPELSRAVESVLKQDFQTDQFEVIVVNDSGAPLQEADWEHASQVQMINIGRRERSIARNVGAAAAQGEYLHFLDDDDWLLPGALQAFWKHSQVNQADWLYGCSQLVDRRGKNLIRLEHGLHGNCLIQVMAGEWIPLQASVIQARSFFAIGGFNPLIPGAEDVDLSRRIALQGEFAGMEETVVCIGMGTERSTTNYDRSLRLARWAREAILNEPGVFSRMRDSASTSFFRGRVVRVYLTSVAWNLRRRRVLPAASRMVFALTGVLLSGMGAFSADFWRAVTRPYRSKTFLRGFREAGLPPTHR